MSLAAAATRGSLRRVLPVFLLALATCEASGPGPAPVPPTRPSDGLLEREDLQALVAAQERRDTPTLLTALRSADARVRARAAYGLASVQARQAVPALEALLDDTARAVRRDAAFALGQAGDSTAQGPLLAALDAEQDPSVRVRLLDALGRSGGEAALRALTLRPRGGPQWDERALAMSRILVRGVGGGAAVDSLVAWLDAGDEGVRQAAAWMLSLVPDARLAAARGDAVRAALDEADSSEPAAADLVTVLGGLGAPQDTPRLLHWLKGGSDWRIRASAAAALQGREDDTEVRNALLDALDDASPHVQETAGRVLSASPQPPAVVQRVAAWLDGHPEEWKPAAPLLAILAIGGRTDAVLAWADRWPADSVGAWERAVEGLAYVPGDEALRRLAQAAASSAPTVSGTALQILAFRWQDEPSPAGRADLYWEAFRGAVERGRPGDLAAVAPVLADPAFVARGSVPLLAAAWDSLAAPADEDAMVAVLGALGGSGEPRAEAPLRRGLASPDGAVRDAAVEALGTLSGEAAGPPPAPGTGEVPAVDATVDWALLKELGPRPRLVLDTDEGQVTVTLVPEEAPATVARVARLAREGRYDGVAFHRVIADFMVQGGDVVRGDGTGRPAHPIPTEITWLRFLRGTAGLATSGKDTGGDQFFLTHSAQPHLDGDYTAFGWVSAGMDVVDRLVQGERTVHATVERGS